MCGITGYTGGGRAVETAITNLKRLEYRGYDSSGIAFPQDEAICIVRAPGKIINLERALASPPEDPRVAIAHTRWATHGRPSEINAHPHRDCTGRIAVVHNGIIENYAELRRELIALGHEFASETDTETLAHLIEQALLEGHDGEDAPVETVAKAVRAALRHVSGSYAVAVLAQDAPDTVFVARKDSPLILGLGEGENFLASDIAAVMRYTRKIVPLEDGDCAILTPDWVRVTDIDGQPVQRDTLVVTWDENAAEKDGYAHFMLKEIHEGPRTVRETLRGRLTEEGKVCLPDLPFTAETWAGFRRITMVACGTAYHAGVVGKRLMEQLLRRPVEVSVASEFRYSDPLVDSETLVILISQSGETADTLAAMREARKKGATTLAIVNVVGSTLAREADAMLLTQAGPEIGVASTKAYLAQLTAITLVALYLAQRTELDSEQQRLCNDLARTLPELPERIKDCLAREDAVRQVAVELARSSCLFYLGRGYDFAVALEAALKLKEISYLHAEAYPAGEMKHGPLALVEPGVAVVGLCTQPATQEKMVSNLEEVKARGATVVAVLRDGDEVPAIADGALSVPAVPEPLMPVVTMVPMQLLAYYVARERGCEIDQPRNLAKSVTVE